MSLQLIQKLDCSEQLGVGGCRLFLEFSVNRQERRELGSVIVLQRGQLVLKKGNKTVQVGIHCCLRFMYLWVVGELRGLLWLAARTCSRYLYTNRSVTEHTVRKETKGRQAAQSQMQVLVTRVAVQNVWCNFYISRQPRRHTRPRDARPGCYTPMSSSVPDRSSRSTSDRATQFLSSTLKSPFLI